MEREYFDSAAKRKWIKEHTVSVGMKLQKKTDADILEFLEGKSKQTIIKAALREYMERHKEEESK